MIGLDWIVLVLTLAAIVLYGLYKSRTTKNLDGYFLSNRSMPWYLVLLSIMGTQASAITFLSGPGQAYADGMRFVQQYFGLPLAMIVVCITFVPIFNRLKVYTAYQFLETRFDKKTRTLTSALFLLQRGLSTGISIYAPSIILSTLFGWDIFWTNIIMGGLLIIYTANGGARAVAYTQQLQLVLIFGAMAAAGYFAVKLLPPGVGFMDALNIGGKLGKLNIITTGQTDKGFDWSDRYNIWSGMIGSFFLMLSYFGTDQSQVGRYLTAQNNTESRLGLLMNGLVKIPMQFAILLIGVLIFSFYQFKGAPINFNAAWVKAVAASPKKDSLTALQAGYDSVQALRSQQVHHFVQANQQGNSASALAAADTLKKLNAATEEKRSQFKQLSKKVTSEEGNDTNFIFLSFVKTYLPAGLKGLLIAIIFLAAWGSIAAALNSLAASTVIDFHQQLGGPQTDAQAYNVSKWYSVGWGLFCIVVAQFAHSLGRSLIEAVNVLGSLFYGVILGIFLLAFYCKKVGGGATFAAAVSVQLCLFALFFNEQIPLLSFLPDIGFLWMNAIGAIGVVGLGLLLQAFKNKPY